MNPWLNFGLLLLSGTLMWGLYVLSVSPAQLEKRFGARAYPICGWLRTLSGIFMGEVILHYWLYRTAPLPIDLATRFGWPYWSIVLVALGVGLPGLILMVWGLRDAGTETAVPNKQTQLHGGIYQHIRHPQLAGEILIWFMLALLLNSPFLVLFSFVWIPVWLHWGKAEEKDLLFRFGASYETYMQNTGMLWPRLR